MLGLVNAVFITAPFSADRFGVVLGCSEAFIFFYRGHL